ncbi:diguanylate cyclase [Acidovorax radicis]|uniref:diguanylate cyclase n=1 Tax=Acidovorax radicis TaxID=758826 RepID=UPI001CF81241|nr:diguanylate cyclase [Acidovorax radicis]UCU99352.1 diguanylate cyclase [Acidovorax radicis]
MHLETIPGPASGAASGVAHAADLAFALPGLQFAGWTVLETLHQGPTSHVVRCVHADGTRAVIKLLRREILGPVDVARLRREFELSRRVSHPGIVSAIALDSHAGALFIVLPDDGAMALDERLRRAGPLPVAQVIEIALAVVDALEALHIHGILHKDIAPANIVMEPEQGLVRLIDFGIAADTVFERALALGSPDPEGTLASMAPEQSGRLARDVDYRCDFYALGATLQELLTGEPPFGHINDPLQAVHAHLALAPHPVLALCPEAPPVLARLIARLLAKEPEHRYQSHHVLRRDLRAIRDGLRDPALQQQVVLAQGDLSEQFRLSGRLYGRSDEASQLHQAFEAAAGGASRLVAIGGVSGIGKTALVQDVQRSLLAHRGQMVSGKFNPLGLGDPCAAFVQALAQRIEQVMAQPLPQRSLWRERMTALLGPNAGVAQAVLPALVELLGGVAPVDSAPGPAESENRFVRTMQMCFAALASAQEPVVVFIDDLQWSDRISRRLLRELVLDEGLHHLLFIVAYRSNEVPPDSLIARDLAALQAVGERRVALSVGPLEVRDVAQWLSDSLQQSVSEVQPLAAACHSKTGGNPFFLGRFLLDLHARQHIWLDRAAPCWRWSIDHIHREKVAENVAEFMLGQLRSLPQATRHALVRAACMGSRFELRALAMACRQTPAQLLQALRPAMVAGLVLPRDARHQWMAVLDENEGRSIQAEFVFAHDRVQEAAYALAPADERPLLHLDIGRMLRDAVPDGAVVDFPIVNHLNAGRAWIDNAAERAQLACLNEQASHRAAEAASFDLAAGYALQAVELRGEAQWQTDAPAALALRVHAARMAALRGDGATTEALIDAALHHATGLGPVAQARLLDVRIESFYTSGQLHKTLELGLSVLRLLGTELPQAATPDDVGRLIAGLREEIEALGLEVLAERPPMTDAPCLQQMAVMAKMTAAAYIARPALLPLLTLVQVRLMVARGHAPVALSAYSVAGLMVAEFLGDYAFGYRLGRMTMGLIERYHWRAVYAHAGFSFNAFLRHWIEGINQGLPGLLAVHHSGLETGNLRHAGLGLYVHGYHCLLGGMPLADLQERLDGDAITLQRIRQPVALDYLNALRAVVRALRQDHWGAEPLEQGIFSAASLERTYNARVDQTGAMFLHAWRCLLAALAGRSAQALASGLKAQPLFAAGRGMVMVPFCVFFTAVAALDEADAGRLPIDQAQRHGEQGSERLDRWARTCADVQPLAHLLHARRATDAGVADAAFGAAHAAALATGNLFLQGLVHWHQARAWYQRGDTPAASNAVAEARALFLRWGGSALAGGLGMLAQPPKPSALGPVVPTAHHGAPATAGAQALDMATLMATVQAVTAEIALDALLARMLEVLRQNAGAGRAAIVLRGPQGEWLLHADGAQLHSPPLALEAAANRLPLEVLRTVLNKGEAVVIDDVCASDAWLRAAYFSARTTRSVLCMPFARMGQVVGALYLDNNAMAGAFSRERIRFLELLLGSVVNAIDNARLYAELRGLADTLEQRVAERTSALAASESRLLSILRNAPVPMTVTRLSSNTFVYVNDRAALESGMGAQTLLGTHPNVIYADPTERERLREQFLRDGVVRDHETSLVVAGGRTLWVLISMVPIEYDGEPCTLTTVVDITERKTMEDALRKAATTDVLTGIANRRHFMDRTEAELARARRHGRPLALAMFDIDHFKRVNDQYGHAVGDEVLRAVARVCVEAMRQHDMVGRVGGEEFALLMPDTGMHSAVALLERLRISLRSLRVPLPAESGAEEVGITASFGVSALQPADTLDALLARADDALYAAKRQGRDQVQVASPPRA